MDLAHTGTPRVRNWSRTRQLLARKAVLRGDRSSLMPFGLAGLSRVTFTEALSAFLIVLAYLYASSTVRSRTRGTYGRTRSDRTSAIRARAAFRGGPSPVT